MARREARKGTVAGAAALASLFTLAACGGGGGTADADGAQVSSIRVMDYYAYEPDNTVFREALDQCAAEHELTIEREAVPGPDLISRVLQQSSSRTLPDLLLLDNPDLQQIAATGALAPLSEFGLSGDGFVDGVVEASTYEGELYGLQPNANTIGLFYNVKMLDEAGIEPPTTWDELREAAEALTDGDRYGIAFSAGANFEGTWQFLPFMWSNGGDETDIATEETAEAVQLWVDLVSEGSASRSVMNWSQADVNDQFRAGNAAMMVNGPWQFPVLDEDPSLEWEVASLPAPAAGDVVVAPLGGETWTIPQTGDRARQEAAARVLECLNSEEMQLELAITRQNVPTRSALQERFVKEEPRMAAFSDMVQDARARTGRLGEEWPQAATSIYTAVQTALTGGAAPMKALQEAQDG